MTMKGLELHGSDVVTEPLRLMMRWCTKLPDVEKKEKEAELDFLNSTLASSLYSCPALPPLLLNLSLSLSRPLPVSLSPLTHSDAHAKKSSEKQGGKRQRHNGDILPTWALRHPVNSHWKRARACVSVSACVRVCGGCVCEWVSVTVPR